MRAQSKSAVTTVVIRLSSARDATSYDKQLTWKICQTLISVCGHCNRLRHAEALCKDICVKRHALVWFEENRARMEQDGADIDELKAAADEAIAAKSMLERFTGYVKERA